jgi:hypothetical protein
MEGEARSIIVWSVKGQLTIFDSYGDQASEILD